MQEARWIRKIVGAIKSLVNANKLSLECTRVLDKGMLLLVLIYSSTTMVWNVMYRSKMQSVQMNNIWGWGLGLRRIDKMRNERHRALWLEGRE